MAEPDIFLSYNREDAEVARRFAEGFEAQGFNVWWDQALRSGEAYDEVTEAALRAAKAVVVLWSPRSVVSRWVRAEASIADESGTLAPVKIEPCDLPVMFRLTQTADLSRWDGAAEDTKWLAFLGDVRRMAGKDAFAPAANPGPVPTATGSGIPTVAVVPITYRGGCEDMEFLAEDLTEEITRELARDSIFEVTAAGRMSAWRGKSVDYEALRRELGVRYLAEGKLQQSGVAIRFTLQVIDTATSSTVWSNRFARNGDEVQDSPEDFASAIVAELGEQILMIETNRSMAKPGSWSGWEHSMRSRGYLGHLGADSALRAIEEARQAVAAAPDFGMAHAEVANALSGPIISHGKEPDEALLREVRAHATRAMQLDGNNPRLLSHLVQANVLLGDDEAALRLARRAMELNPNFPVGYLQLGWALENLDRLDDAIAVYERQRALTSHDHSRYMAFTNLGKCHLLKGRPEEALDCLDQALALHPDYPLALKWKAIVAAQMGKEIDGLAAIRRLRQAASDRTIDQHVRQMEFYSRLADRLTEPVATLRRLWDATEPQG